VAGRSTRSLDVMFTVRIDAAARPALDRALASEGSSRPGITIHRQGPIADLTRSPSGEASWSVERQEPWKVRIGSFDTIPDDAADVVIIDGVRVWLAFIPREGESGVVVTLRNGQLHVEAT
jgi:hypothetical protein